MTQESPFDRAVSVAFEYLKRAPQGSRALEHLELMAEGSVALQNKPDDLLEAAATDFYSLQLVKQGLAQKLLYEESLTRSEKEWLAKYLVGEVEELKPGKRAPGALMDELNIAMAVYHAAEAGRIKATRNEATYPEESACDAVAKAMTKLGRKPRSFRHIKTIWEKWGHLH